MRRHGGLDDTKDITLRTVRGETSRGSQGIETDKGGQTLALILQQVKYYADARNSEVGRSSTVIRFLKSYEVTLTTTGFDCKQNADIFRNAEISLHIATYPE